MALHVAAILVSLVIAAGVTVELFRLLREPPPRRPRTRGRSALVAQFVIAGVLGVAVAVWLADLGNQDLGRLIALALLVVGLLRVRRSYRSGDIDTNSRAKGARAGFPSPLWLLVFGLVTGGIIGAALFLGRSGALASVVGGTAFFLLFIGTSMFVSRRWRRRAGDKPPYHP